MIWLPYSLICFSNLSMMTYYFYSNCFLNSLSLCKNSSFYKWIFFWASNFKFSVSDSLSCSNLLNNCYNSSFFYCYSLKASSRREFLILKSSLSVFSFVNFPAKYPFNISSVAYLNFKDRCTNILNWFYSVTFSHASYPFTSKTHQNLWKGII